MKKYYRVHVRAVIALDVAAESKEQAKRIAAAAVYTPACNLLEPWDYDTIDALHGAGVYVWADGGDGEAFAGKLDGSNVEIVDEQSASEAEVSKLSKAVEELAAMMGNEMELAEATGNPVMAA